jgi:hypothetical protein
MSFDSNRFHAQFDSNAKQLLDEIRETLLEGPGTATREQIVGQLIMDNLFAHDLDPDLAGREARDIFTGYLTVEQKAQLVKIADHLGPDWAQALYHAAVFITKVA